MELKRICQPAPPTPVLHIGPDAEGDVAIFATVGLAKIKLAHIDGDGDLVLTLVSHSNRALLNSFIHFNAGGWWMAA
jgi:hypothetical protein